jgi:ferredoxin
MKAFIDKNVCIGCGLCPQICPAVFSMTEDGYAQVIVDPVPAEQEAACKEAVSQCPVEAIKI